MDRYTARGLIQDVERGYLVGVVGEAVDVSHAFEQLRRDHHPDEAMTFHRANGRERIQHVSGGEVIFHGLRGRVVDVVVAVSPISETDQVDLRAMLSTRSDSALILAR